MDTARTEASEGYCESKKHLSFSFKLGILIHEFPSFKNLNFENIVAFALRTYTSEHGGVPNQAKEFQ
jgi:hypothetical protein